MTNFRVLTFNILGFSNDAATDTHQRKALIVDAIERGAYDIAFLQEVKTMWGEDGQLRHHSETYFRQSKVYRSSAIFAYADQRALSQNAEGLIARLPIKDMAFGNLPMGLFGRAYVRAAIEVGASTVNVLTTHLEPPAIGRMISQYGATEQLQNQRRLLQLKALYDIAESLDSNTPLIIGGDFNIESDDSALRSWIAQLGLKEVFPDTRSTPRKSFATHPSPSFDCGLDMRLDHIFFRSGRSKSLVLVDEGFAFQEPVAPRNELFYGYLSDHRGVFADFSIDE